jgi:hypothetical protein
MFYIIASIALQILLFIFLFMSSFKFAKRIWITSFLNEFIHRRSNCRLLFFHCIQKGLQMATQTMGKDGKAIRRNHHVGLVSPSLLCKHSLSRLLLLAVGDKSNWTALCKKGIHLECLNTEMEGKGPERSKNPSNRKIWFLFSLVFEIYYNFSKKTEIKKINLFLCLNT